MEPEPLYNLLQLPKGVALPGEEVEEELPQGGKKKYLPPASRKDPKFLELQKVLTEWINATLLPEHIVVRSLEEDMFDGLVLHHLFREPRPTWPPASVPRRDSCPAQTSVGKSSHLLWRQYRGNRVFVGSGSAGDVFDELFKLAPEKVGTVKEAIMSFVNQKLERLGLSVQDLDTQFADGVILLLLIGQLEGFFLHLKEFHLTPRSPAEMLHNVTLALTLLKDEGLLSHPVSPEDIVNKDAKSTLRVLYSLFCKHKLKVDKDGRPQAPTN
nr:gamma-parvin [Cavia porcellus]